MSSNSSTGVPAGRLGSIVRQSGTVFVGKVTLSVLSVLSAIVLARLLGAESLGYFQLGLVIVQLTTIFSVLGFETGLTRYLPLLAGDAPARIRGLLTFNVLLTLLLSLSFSGLIFFFAPFLATHYFQSEAMAGTLRAFSFYLPVFALMRVGLGGINGSKRADLSSNVVNILCPGLYLISLLGVAFLGLGLMGAIGARIVTHLAAVSVFGIFLLRRYPQLDGPDTGAPQYSATKYLSYSVPLMFIGLTYFLVGHLDLLMLGYFVAEREVGLYAAATRLALFVIIGLEVILPILAPHFSELSKVGDNRAIKALFNNTTKWVFYLGLIAFGTLAVLRVQILSVFGTEFAEAAPLLLILLGGQLVNAMTGPAGQLLVMSGKQKWEIGNTAGMLVLNVVLNLLLIPSYGTVGAAVATGVAIAVVNVVKLTEVSILYSFVPYEREYIKGVVAAVAGGGACYYARSMLASMTVANDVLIVGVCGPMFFMVFAAAVYALGLTVADKEMGQFLMMRFGRRSQVAG